MHEVYEVCKRLKAAGFPQERADYLINAEGIEMRMHASLRCMAVAQPNASDCMKFAAEKWPERSFAVGWDTELSPPAWWAHIVSGNGNVRELVEGAPDPDQAARLALAAALEADHVAK